MKLLVTGGAGFIGSAFVRLAIQERWATRVINFDALTYAGNLENLTAVQDDPAYRFVRGDITDSAAVNAILQEEQPDVIIHFAAESHVDRSILGPGAFFETNLRGTFTMLEAARAAGIRRFIHVSTDEVYGSIEAPNRADENYPLHTSSPYSASKAGSDLLALSYYTTYKLPLLVTRASNNYGPYQFPEKLIPLMIANAMEDRPLPIYGDGLQIREWLWVDDHCRGIRSLLDASDPGQIYNISASCAHTNKEVVERILRDPRQTAQPDDAGYGSPRTRPPLRHFEREAPQCNRVGGFGLLRRWIGAHHRLVSEQYRMDGTGPFGRVPLVLPRQLRSARRGLTHQFVSEPSGRW